MKFTHQPGATPIDGFTIRRGIHRGGFGEVYYAVSDGGKEVALKLLKNEQEIELRGVKQCLNLKHPNLVNLFDVRSDALGESWVVMEYVNGASLEDVLASFPNGLPIDEIREWIAGLVEGVNYLHERGIVHRDLKPANVYRENGTVKVGDVGLSKKLGSDRRGAHTQSVGTVYYMAPEVARGQYGPEVDVYSLGIMLYELITGQVPFAGETTAEVLMKHLTTQPDLSHVPENLRSVVARALEKDPAKRTSSVRQLAEDFAAASNPAHDSMDSKFASAGEASRSREVDIPPSVPQPPPLTDKLQTISTSEPVARPFMSPVPPLPSRGNPQKPTSTSKPIKSDTKRRLKNSTHPKNSQTRKWLNYAIVVIIALLIFSPGTLRAWTGLGLIGLACSAAIFSKPRSFVREDANGFASIEDIIESPFSQRHLDAPWRRLPLGSLFSHNALCELSQSLSLASFVACLLSIGVLFGEEFIHQRKTPLAIESAVHFMTVTMTGAWTLLISQQCIRRTDWGDRHPRFTNLIAGMLIASLAYGLDRFLYIEFPRMANHQSMFNSLGVHALSIDHHNPTWLGYSVFFGGLFWIRRWWLDMTQERTHRFSLSRLGTAWMAAFLLTTIFEFPGTLGLLWSMAISTTVQLTSPWEGPSIRRTRGRS